MGVKIGGGGSDISNTLKEIDEIKQEMAQTAIQSMNGGEVQAGNIGAKPRKGDRRSAMMTGQAANAATVQKAAPLSEAEQLTKDLTEKLQKLGYLPQPPAKITAEMANEAMKKFILDNMDKVPSGKDEGDINDIWFLLDKLMAENNQRSNRSPGQWSGREPANRPAALPAAGSYSGRPAPNQGALQEQAARNVATANPPPEPGSIQARVADATRAYMGTSTRAGPDGGNLACAWSVNNILSNAGLQKVGSNPNYVPSVEQALQGGRGTRIDPSQAGPGDIVIWPNGHHIGIAMGNGQVANNSSSRAAFVNMQNLPAGCRVYRLNS